MPDGPSPTLERRWAPGTSRGVPIPWWLKLGAKLALARLPVGYRGWARLGLFRHGRADRDPEAAVAQYERAHAAHLDRAGRPPRAVLELGPGDALCSALAAAARGVGASVLVDVGDFATRDMAVYRRIAALLAAAGRPLPPAAAESPTREALLAALGARYLTGGVASLAALPDGSIDLGYSFAVIEHVARDEVATLFRELFRLTAPGGTGYHFIDLSDHLGGGLNHLRFPDRIWEARWFARAGGFYTNRLREGEILALARAAGFEAAVPERWRWAVPPLARARRAARFRGTAEAELTVAACFLALRRPG